MKHPLVKNEKEILSAFRAGTSGNALAKKHGVSATAVYSFLRSRLGENYVTEIIRERREEEREQSAYKALLTARMKIPVRSLNSHLRKVGLTFQMSSTQTGGISSRYIDLSNGKKAVIRRGLFRELQGNSYHYIGPTKNLPKGVSFTLIRYPDGNWLILPRKVVPAKPTVFVWNRIKKKNPHRRGTPNWGQYMNNWEQLRL